MDCRRVRRQHRRVPRAWWLTAWAAAVTSTAYARATPEEQNLRNNTHYIAPDAKTVLVAALSLLLGAAVTAILALAPVYALSHAWGWLLRGQGVLACPAATRRPR